MGLFRNRLSVLCLALLTALPVVAAPASVTPTQKSVATNGVVPFQLLDGRILLNARVNGRGPFRFILDSGSNIHVLRPEVADALALKPEPEEKPGDAAQNKELPTARVSSIQIGSVVLHNQQVEVLSLRQLASFFGKTKIDGILGLPVFEQAVLKIDYDRRLITFTPFNQFIYTGSGKVLSFEQDDSGPAVYANLDGIPGSFGVDTGARSSLLLNPAFVQQNFLVQKYSPNFEGLSGWGLGDPVKTRLARAKRLNLAGFEISSPVVQLRTDGSSSSEQQDGVIGADVLERFSVIFDYKHHQLILEPNRNFDREDSYDRTGMWVAQEGGELPILDVINGGPAAEAGLKPGDKITAVNGVPASKLALPELRQQWKAEPPGTKLRLTVTESASADAATVSAPTKDSTPRQSATKRATEKEIVLVLRDLV